MKNLILKKISIASLLGVLCGVHLPLSAETSPQQMQKTLLTDSRECQAPTNEDYMSLIISTSLDHLPLIEKLTKQYCFQVDSFDFNRINQPHPIFYSTRPSVLSFYLQNSRSFINLIHPELGMDILSSILTFPYGPYDIMSLEDKNMMLQNLYKHDQSVSASLFENPLQTADNYKEKYLDPKVWDNYNQMVSLASSYYENLLTLPEDKHGNNVMFYSVLVNQPEPLEKLLIIPYHNLYRQNNDGYTLFHLAFNTPNFWGDSEEWFSKKNRINKILLDNFRADRTNMLDLPDVTFNEFIELLKYNNHELYEGIIQKQQEIGLDVPLDTMIFEGDFTVDDIIAHHINQMSRYLTHYDDESQ